MAAVLNVKTKNELQKLITNKKLVIIKWGATWCGPCHQFAPIFEAIARECVSSDVAFVSIDSDDFCLDGIRLLPTTSAHHGDLTAKKSWVGLLTPKSFREKVEGVCTELQIAFK